MILCRLGIIDILVTFGISCGSNGCLESKYYCPRIGDYSLTFQSNLYVDMRRKNRFDSSNMKFSSTESFFMCITNYAWMKTRVRMYAAYQHTAFGLDISARCFARARNRILSFNRALEQQQRLVVFLLFLTLVLFRTLWHTKRCELLRIILLLRKLKKIEVIETIGKSILETYYGHHASNEEEEGKPAPGSWDPTKDGIQENFKNNENHRIIP